MDVDRASPTHDNMDEEDSEVEEGGRLAKTDSWDDHSGSGTPVTTPDDEEGGSESFVPASKPRTKVKPKPEEAHTTEKEHVNVVFIGHVGKKNYFWWNVTWNLIFFCSDT